VKYFVTIGLLFGLANLALAQQSEVEKMMKHVQAVRVEVAPEIDGKLDDAAWKHAEPAVDFVQTSPYPGAPSAQPAEVRIVYDNTALYIGAALFDSAPDSILRQMSVRDDDCNCDAFGIVLDTYNSDNNSFNFFISAAGVQMDARESSEGDDKSWNAVWQSKVEINDKGWYVEMKIPFSAVRFPDSDVQTWGFNMYRRIRRTRENSNWSEVDPAVDGYINQAGELNGIENVKSPMRLSFSPYISGYVEHFPHDVDGVSNYSSSINGGMDLKYGLNDAFTLDMTLVPDFGQVQSDNQVLNLSPFEVQFNENRQFFTEGTEIFNKGGLFYSRRIGGAPIDMYAVSSQLEDGEEIVENPSQSQLVNATKVSGRTSGGLGVGVFNGVSKSMYATVRDMEGNEREVLTDPLTNYNVLVLDQNLKNNSSISFVNTNVMRAGSHYEANVTGAMFDLATKGNKYGTRGAFKLTQKYSASEESPELGHSYFVDIAKRSGNLGWGMWHSVESDTYDPNDLGFLYNNNSSGYGAEVNYNIYEPFGPFNSLWTNASTYYERLYNPNKFADFNIAAELGVSWKGFTATGLNFVIEPIETYDFFEPRVWGRFYAWQPSRNLAGWVSTDYRKKFAVDARANFRQFDAEERTRFNMGFSPRWRANDKLMFILDVGRGGFYNDEGAALDQSGQGTIIGEDIIFGRRDQITWENILNASYIFTNRMGLTLRVRHYWSTLTYRSFHVLDEDGHLAETDYTGHDENDYSLHNNSFDAFNVDMVYSWVFAPGSELTVVWKNAILRGDTQYDPAYFDNLKNTLESSQTNSFSIKVLYYIDYLSLKKKSS
jgi:hypothetical protein